MRTCKRGHATEIGKRCRLCDRASRKRFDARRFADGLTPQERLKTARQKWS